MSDLKNYYLEAFDSCPICKEKSFFQYLVVNNHQLVECESCHHIWLQMPANKNICINDLYEAVDYYSDFGGSGFEVGGYLKHGLQDGLSSFYFRNRLLPVAELTKNKKLEYLDYGCSAGHLLLMAKNELSWKVKGYDLSKVSVDKCLENGLNVTQGGIESLSQDNSTYDVISLFHCLEHIVNPTELLNVLKLKLKENGHLIIEVPNAKSFPAKILKEKWKGLLLPYHIHHFSKKSLTQLISSLDLEVIICHTPFVPLSIINVVHFGKILGKIKKMILFRTKSETKSGFPNKKVILNISKAPNLKTKNILLKLINFPFDLLLYLFSANEVLYLIARKKNE